MYYNSIGEDRDDGWQLVKDAGMNVDVLHIR